MSAQLSQDQRNAFSSHIDLCMELTSIRPFYTDKMQAGFSGLTISAILSAAPLRSCQPDWACFCAATSCVSTRLPKRMIRHEMLPQTSKSYKLASLLKSHSRLIGQASSVDDPFPPSSAVRRLSTGSSIVKFRSLSIGYQRE